MSLSIQRNLSRESPEADKAPTVRCPHCSQHFTYGGEVGVSYDDDRAEMDSEMRATDEYAGRGEDPSAEAGRSRRLADKGGESNESFTSYLAKRRAARAGSR